jgi:Amt family ammonium transporter
LKPDRTEKSSTMNKLLVSFTLGLSLALGGLAAIAQTAPEAPITATQVVAQADTAAATAAVPAAAAAAPAAAEAAPGETVDKGDVAWMMIATVLVIMMVIPGLALFYGGLVRSKNMLSVLLQVMVVFSMISILWAVYGYSLTFGGEGLIFGNLSKAFLMGVTPDTLAATFTPGVMIPEHIFIAFQCTFAGITCALIVGSLA